MHCRKLHQDLELEVFKGLFESGPPPFGRIGSGSTGGYGYAQGAVHEYEPHNYPVRPPAIVGCPNISHSMEIKIPNHAVGDILAAGGSNITNIGQMSGDKVKLNDQSAVRPVLLRSRGLPSKWMQHKIFFKPTLHLPYNASIVTSIKSLINNRSTKLPRRGICIMQVGIHISGYL
ncbi:hypothetical protein MKX03_002025 [Papaver bracteatum]|nr:hypothetical protein MKX03_002025 [Papaver bracteatum]